jgi:hypothetical protein
MTHMLTFFTLLLKLFRHQSASGAMQLRGGSHCDHTYRSMRAGVSLRTQELLLIVWISRYLDLFVYVFTAAAPSHTHCNDLISSECVNSFV